MSEPIAWLERGYDKPGAFRYPLTEEIFTPFGLFQVVPDHPDGCSCEEPSP